MVHRGIRILHQRFCLGPIIRVGDGADADREIQIVLIDEMRRAQRCEYFFGADGGVLCVRHFRKQDHEFVAALPADGVRGTHAGDQPLRYRLQQPVTDGVAQRIIDVLETIHVQEQHRQFSPMTLRERHRFSQPVVQQQPVG